MAGKVPFVPGVTYSLSWAYRWRAASSSWEELKAGLWFVERYEGGEAIVKMLRVLVLDLVKMANGRRLYLGWQLVWTQVSRYNLEIRETSNRGEK